MVPPTVRRGDHAVEVRGAAAAPIAHAAARGRTAVQRAVGPVAR